MKREEQTVKVRARDFAQAVEQLRYRLRDPEDEGGSATGLWHVEIAEFNFVVDDALAKLEWTFEVWPEE